MATPKQNYARQFQAYAQSIEPDIPASVRTYSIFNPDTGTWQRMTNGFRSPIPAQGQVAIPVQVPVQPAVDPVVQALALARQTQGRDWAMPLPQAPAQIPLGGSRRRSPASGGGTVVVPMDQAQSVPQTAPKRGFDVSPLGETESVPLKLAPRPVDRFLATVSPDNQTPVYLPIPEALPAKKANVPNLNINKKKPFALQTKSEREAEAEEESSAEGRKFRRIIKAKEDGTYSPFKELFGFYGWVPDYFK